MDSLRIALADDDEGVRTMVAEWLGAMGHRVETVEDGQALVAVCRSTPIDLIVSDVRMPQLDGLTAVIQLRRELGVPTVLMSGSWAVSEMEQAAAVGAAVLDKPFRQIDLVAAMTRAVAQRQTGRRRVLIDHSANDGLSERLATLGYEVIVCTAGMVEAAAESMCPHLILIVAGADGWGAVRRVRERTWGRMVQILAISGSEDTDQRSESLAVGCDGYLVRPVAVDEVASLLTDRTNS